MARTSVPFEIDGNVLAAERRKRGIYGQDLARVVKMHPTRLSRIERGWEFPSEAQAEAMARELGVSLESLARKR